MGRAFEFRKARKMKRWGMMAKTFTRIGKDIVIAVKSGGPDPTTNSRLRAIMQNAKTVNMPKENVERAIKRASSKDEADYKEMVYEGYAPHGVAILVECTTDNPTRTVANVRSYFNKCGGSLGTSGMLDFIFDRKCIFKITADPKLDLEEMELELIDFGADEIFLDEVGYELKGADFERIPNDTKQLTEEQVADVEKLIEKLEEDDDVQNVYHNMG
jgi:YebC/PmpR family DNA-binding regulatory protein